MIVVVAKIMDAVGAVVFGVVVVVVGMSKVAARGSCPLHTSGPGAQSMDFAGVRWLVQHKLQQRTPCLLALGIRA